MSLEEEETENLFSYGTLQAEGGRQKWTPCETLMRRAVREQQGRFLTDDLVMNAAQVDAFSKTKLMPDAREPFRNLHIARCADVERIVLRGERDHIRNARPAFFRFPLDSFVIPRFNFGPRAERQLCWRRGFDICAHAALRFSLAGDVARGRALNGRTFDVARSCASAFLWSAFAALAVTWRPANNRAPSLDTMNEHDVVNVASARACALLKTATRSFCVCGALLSGGLLLYAFIV